MKFKNYNKGFTLIELLVVIAIIGILSSVVISSLSRARTKGKDAAIQAGLSSTRAQAELFYSTNGNYGTGVTSTACTGSGIGTLFSTASSSDGLSNIIAGIANNVNGTASLATTEAVCNTSPTTGNATSWAMAVKGATTGTFYCVDSSGASKVYNATSSPIATALTGASGTGAIVAAATSCN